MASVIGAAVGVIGSIIGGQQAQRAGKEEQQAKDFEAQDYHIQAGQAMAGAERDMAAEDRQSKLVSSRLQALVAAGGGSATDPSSVKLAADLEGEGAYRKAMTIYNGEAEARRLNLAGDLATFEGKVAKHGGQAQSQLYGMQGAGYILKGASSLYSKYATTPSPTSTTSTYGTANARGSSKSYGAGVGGSD